MAYGDNTLNADHQWTFNNVLTDNIGSLTLTNTGGVFVATPITRDSTHSFQTNGRDDLATVTPTTDSGSVELSQYAFSGWFMVSQIQGPPTLIYKQGGTNGFAIFLWAGNNVMLQVKCNGVIRQIFSDIALTSNRPYHFVVRFSGSAFDNEVSFYIDAVKQTLNKDGVTPNGATMNAHTGTHCFGENGTSSVDVQVGTESVLVKAPLNGYWSQWWTWSGINAALSESDINEDIFGAGAIPQITITSDTQAAMQSQLDTYTGGSSNDEPLVFLIEGVTGDGDLGLSLDYTFDPRSSQHIRYEGSGTLTWTNLNGANASTFSGNVVIENPANLSINNLVVGSEVRVYDNNGVDSNDLGAELAGTETLIGTSFVYSHSGLSNDVVVQIIRDGYFEILQPLTLTSNDQSFSLIQEQDNNT